MILQTLMYSVKLNNVLDDLIDVQAKTRLLVSCSVLILAETLPSSARNSFIFIIYCEYVLDQSIPSNVSFILKSQSLVYTAGSTVLPSSSRVGLYRYADPHILYNCYGFLHQLDD